MRAVHRYVLLILAVCAAMFGCGPDGESPEPDTAPEDACELPEPLSVVWTCEFENGDDCGFEPAGIGPDADALVTLSNLGDGLDGSAYLRVYNRTLSGDPTADGVCLALSLDRFCPETRYTLEGYKAWSGARANEQMDQFVYSFGISGSDEDPLSETNVFRHPTWDYPEGDWYKFGVYGFAATDGFANICFGTNSTEQFLTDRLTVSTTGLAQKNWPGFFYPNCQPILTARTPLSLEANVRFVPEPVVGL